MAKTEKLATLSRPLPTDVQVLQALASLFALPASEVTPGTSKDEKNVFFSTSAAAVLPWRAPVDCHIVSVIGIGTAFYLSWVSEGYAVADASTTTMFKPEIICKVPGASLLIKLNVAVKKDQIIYILTNAGQLGHFAYTED